MRIFSRGGNQHCFIELGNDSAAEDENPEKGAEANMLGREIQSFWVNDTE